MAAPPPPAAGETLCRWSVLGTVCGHKNKSSETVMTMVTLITGATSELGGGLVDALTGLPQPLRLTAWGGADDSVDAEEKARLLADCSALVHLVPHLAGCRDSNATGDWLDACTRATYDLMLAAQQHGVPHFVLVSSLDVLVNLEPDLHPASIQPSWRPRPSVSPGSLGPHCAEFVARQFAFLPGASMRVSILRAGDWHRDATSRFWTSSSDIAGAVVAALETEVDKASPMYAVKHCGEQQKGWAAPAATPGISTMAACAKRQPRSAVLFGANGMMGPPVASALASDGLELLLTDLEAASALRDEAQRSRENAFGADTPHQKETFALPPGSRVSRAVVDVGEADEVERAASGSDVVVYCAVVREHRRLAFRVNTQGTYNAIRAAVAAGHDRFVNSGPVRCIVGGFDGGYQLAAGGASELSGKSPPWSGTGLYQVSHSREYARGLTPPLLDGWNESMLNEYM